MTWTQNGTTYQAAYVSAYTYQTLPQISVNGGVAAAGQTTAERVLSLGIPNTITGPGTYQLPQSSSSVTTIPNGGLLWPDNGSPRSYNTIYGPAATNGTITLTEYDRAAGRMVGTFQFTAKSPDASSTPQTVTIAAGSFRLTKLQAAPGGL